MTATRDGRTGDTQSLPTTGQVNVGPEVIKDVKALQKWSPEILQAVVEDFEARIQLGISRYGHPLQTHNGRDAVLDAYEELMDAAHYLKQAYLEGKSPKMRLAYICVLDWVVAVKQYASR
jgi:hypothetical protein